MENTCNLTDRNNVHILMLSANVNRMLNAPKLIGKYKTFEFKNKIQGIFNIYIVFQQIKFESRNS